MNRDGVLYAFGSKTTPPAQALGKDADKWEAARDAVHGAGIEYAYRRSVFAGDRIRLHGFEWSVASDSVSLMSVASPAAVLAAKDVQSAIDIMFRPAKQGGRAGAVNGTADLRSHLEIARDAARGMVTDLGNVDRAKVDLLHGSLAKALEVATQAATDAHNRGAIDALHDVCRRIEALEQNLRSVEELRATAPDSSAKKPS